MVLESRFTCVILLHETPLTTRMKVSLQAHPASWNRHPCPPPPNHLKEAENPSVQNNELVILQGKSPDQNPLAKLSLQGTRVMAGDRSHGRNHAPESSTPLPMIPGAQETHFCLI